LRAAHPTLKGGVCFGAARPVFWISEIFESLLPRFPFWTIETLLWFPLNRHQCFIGSKEHEKRARVHFIPNLKVGVFVTLCAPEVIKMVPMLKLDRAWRP
jgi:hypothetical protein